MASQQPTITVTSGAVVQRKTVVEMIQEVQKRIQSFGPGPYTPEQAKDIEKLKLIYAKLTTPQDPIQGARKVIINPSGNPATGQVHIAMATPVTHMVAGVANQQTIATMQRIAPAATTSGTAVITPTTTVTIIPQGASLPQKVQVAGGAVMTPRHIQHIQVQAQPQAVQVVAAQSTVGTPVTITQPISLQGQVKVGVPVSGHTVLAAGQRTLAGSPSTSIVTTGCASLAGIKHTLPTGLKIATQSPTVVHSVPMQRQLVPNKMPGTVPITTAPSGTPGGIPNIAPAPSASAVPKSLISHGGLTSRVDTVSPQPQQILTKRRLQELLHELDPREQMDDDVEDLLLQIADDFIENVVNASCQIAKHRKSNTLEVKDVQLHLERCWNMWIPGLGSDELRPYKKTSATEAHKQRLALIRKSLKK